MNKTRKVITLLLICFICVFSNEVFAKFCSKCGTEAKEESAFCEKCGNKFGETISDEKKDYTGSSALKYLEEQYIYLANLPIISYNAERAKFIVELNKIQKDSLNNDKTIKKEFFAPILMSLCFGGLDLAFNASIEKMKSKYGHSYTSFNNKGYQEVHDEAVSRVDFFNSCSKIDVLKFEVKEIKEKERKKTKSRHANFTFKEDISKYDYIYIMIIDGEYYNNASLIAKKDFDNNKSVTLKNIKTYGCGNQHFVIGCVK